MAIKPTEITASILRERKRVSRNSESAVTNSIIHKVQFVLNDKTGIDVTKINVYIDNVITVEKDIVVNMTDDSDESKEPHIINVSNEKAYITGAATNVNRVKHIAAMLDIDKVNDKVSTFDVPLKAVDDKGMEVKGINVSIPSVSVDAVMLNTKTVKLEVPIVDDDNADVERTYNLPKEIVIKGTAETLENISSIEAKKIDLREIYKTSEVKIEPILPDGISVDEDSENLKMTVMVVGLETGKFTYNSEEVEIRGLKENLSAEVVDKNITITVKGKATVLNSLSKESFKLYLNASNISAGKHELEIKCDAAADIRDMTLNPDKLTVILTELNSDFDISDKEEISEE